MKLKDPELYEKISEYIEKTRISDGVIPTVRQVEAALKIPKSTVHR